jgi:prepilin-type N-terminal cleavage/methylation domain-containing protein
MSLKSRYGFGLLEVLLSLAVISVIAFMTIGYFATVREEERSSNFMMQLKNINNTLQDYVNAHVGVAMNMGAAFASLNPDDTENLWIANKPYTIALLNSSQINADSLNCEMAYSIVATLPISLLTSTQHLNALINKITDAFQPLNSASTTATQIVYIQHTSTQLTLAFCLL